MGENTERGIHTKLGIVALRILFAVPGIALIGAAVPRLMSGLAVEAAFPVPSYIEGNIQLPKTAYAQAQDVLARANIADGQTKILQAEAAYLAGSPIEKVESILKPALGYAPSSARGWTLLAELEVAKQPQIGASALALGLQFAPFDYWLAGRRANVGAQLWNEMDADGKNSLLRQTRLLWSEEQFRGKIAALYMTESGRALVARAFADEPDTLRELNRRTMRDYIAP